MNTDVLARFEQQLDALVSNYERLKRENTAMREKQGLLSCEHDVLQEKYSASVDYIEKMLEKLKVIESEM